ncbi:MAG: F0F1 ATP synthase subunit A [Deltaproteobacteria bacterium]|nr:F0F1 ATP synthase subunit A [Deltaproteobacteria bacterium]
MLDKFSWLGHLFHLDPHSVHIHHLIAVSIFVTLLGLVAYVRLRQTEKALLPDGSITMGSIFEVAAEKLLGLLEGIMGKEHAKHYLPVVGSVFIFIFVSNLVGLIPGVLPPTESINTTLAFGIFVFIYFNYVGIKTQGLIPYLKHFAGPIIFLAPLIFVLEIIGIAVRPLSLGMRLYGNIFGDHLVLSIFSGLVPYVIPVVFLLIATFVSFMQAFVFSLLTAIYITLSLPHEEHH